MSFSVPLVWKTEASSQSPARVTWRGLRFKAGRGGRAVKGKVKMLQAKKEWTV